jgi:hypothetical protein
MLIVYIFQNLHLFFSQHHLFSFNYNFITVYIIDISFLIYFNF